jgi:hypothetical protein
MGMGMGMVLLLPLKQHSCPRHYTGKKEPTRSEMGKKCKGLSLSLAMQKSKKMKILYPLENNSTHLPFFEISPDLREKNTSVCDTVS